MESKIKLRTLDASGEGPLGDPAASPTGGAEPLFDNADGGFRTCDIHINKPSSALDCCRIVSRPKLPETCQHEPRD